MNLVERSADTLVRHIDDLRAVIDTVKATHPFSLVAMVVLPEHLNAIWRLLPGDADYPIRSSLIERGMVSLDWGGNVGDDVCGYGER
ncbi:hypothetical protein [Immundisolibacter cernigliae]|uniref:Transposase IS200-like domain-containing protein n=1 Tax=Immundisolibacter cernigliae TaxID=1810504 RepID=A0A1B1YQZ4_9GAMM|nr:hypothetical protein [Immundisolibacter cernigliae]ANX03181.1 hypothetical protein PG2T_02570 [Immundisolibacter cernigliae]